MNSYFEQMRLESRLIVIVRMCVTRVFLTFQAETHLVFPWSASVDQLRQVRETIAAERYQRLGADQRASCSSTSSSTSSPAPTPTVAAEPQRPIELPPSGVGIIITIIEKISELKNRNVCAL